MTGLKLIITKWSNRLVSRQFTCDFHPENFSNVDKHCINLETNTQVVHADNTLLSPSIRMGCVGTTRSVCCVTLCSVHQ